MKKIVLFLFLILTWQASFGNAKIMNPGEAHGQLVFLSSEDVLNESEKYKSLSPLSIPVFAEMPFNMSVVAGAITLLKQSLLSHVQIKSRARKIPNLDISSLPGGMKNELFSKFTDGDYIYLKLYKEGEIVVESSSEEQALDFYKQKLLQMEPISLEANLQESNILTSEQMSWQDFDKVGSKAANYAELAKALNSVDNQVVRPSVAVPFFYYDQFIQMNPHIESMIKKINRDPLMRKVSASQYRDDKLAELREQIEENSVVDEDFLQSLLVELDKFEDDQGGKLKMKLRSSTNAEDLADFNGAGLYSSKSYKPMKKGKEKSEKKKLKSLKEAVLRVWASVWNLRAFEERQAFSIPHDQVYMGIQINPSYSDEEVDGVLVTKNLSDNQDLSGAGVYIEAQRGDTHSVANPQAGVRAEKIVVLYDEKDPLEVESYQIHFLARSNVADDMETILEADNPHPVMEEREVLELVYQSLKAQAHFNSIFQKEGGEQVPLDIEFKVDDLNKGERRVYLKQARPFIQ